jgi:hypothetical protein
MKITLTALSLMLVLGSVSSVQAALSPAATQHKDFTATHNAVTKPTESDFAATHTVNTHMGAFDVNKDSVVGKHPDSSESCSYIAPCT